MRPSRGLVDAVRPLPRRPAPDRILLFAFAGSGQCAADLNRRHRSIQTLQVGGWDAPVGITLVADRLSTVMLFTSSVVLFSVMWYAITAALVAASILAIAIRGFSLSLDFEGGTKLNMPAADLVAEQVGDIGVHALGRLVIHLVLVVRGPVVIGDDLEEIGHSAKRRLCMV